MTLHKKIFNGNIYLGSEILGIPRSTLQGWITLNNKRNTVEKQYDLVANLTWGDVKKRYDTRITDKFMFLGDEEKVDLSKYKVLRGHTVVLSAFCGVPAAKRAKLARKAKEAKARGEECKTGKFDLVNRLFKNQYSARAL